MVQVQQAFTNLHYIGLVTVIPFLQLEVTRLNEPGFKMLFKNSGFSLEFENKLQRIVIPQMLDLTLSRQLPPFRKWSLRSSSTLENWRLKIHCGPINHPIEKENHLKQQTKPPFFWVENVTFGCNTLLHWFRLFFQMIKKESDLHSFQDAASDALPTKPERHTLSSISTIHLFLRFLLDEFFVGLK